MIFELQDQGSSILSCLIVIPLVGALLVGFLPQMRIWSIKLLASAISLLSFVLSVLLIIGFEKGNTALQYAESHLWIRSLGVSYSVGVDGLSIWFVLLTTFLSFLVILSSSSVKLHPRGYLAMMLLLESAMLGTFLSVDAISFYVFWELMLVPMYFLIGVWGGERRVYAALKFVLYTALGSLLMLVAIAYIGHLYFQQFGQWSFALADWQDLTFSREEQLWLFGAFALAFAIKVPVFPLHTWLPDAHVEAPTGGSVILAGVLLKMGLFGLLRFAVPLFPQAVVANSGIFAVLGVIGIVYGALVAWVQTDIKKLVAYSSVSHLGFCVLGFAALNAQGLQGSVLQMLNHGVSTAALFFLVGVLYDRKHTRAVADYQGLASKVPFFSVFFLIFTLSSIGLPLTNGFVGEFLILLGGFNYDPLLGVVAVTGVILGAMYMLSLYRRVVFGRLNTDKNGDLKDLSWREGFVLGSLALLVFYVGLFPNRVLGYIDPSVNVLITHVKNSVTYDLPHDVR